MKTSKFIFTTLTIVMWSVTLTFAQQGQPNPADARATTISKKTGTATTAPVTEKFKVSGNCGMCKNNIEKAAKMKGVSKADWNTETKVLTLKYDPSVVTADTVLKSIADAGYDNEKYKADSKSYSKLDACCQYDRTK